MCDISCFIARSILQLFFSFFFFFNDTATTEIYTLSLHDALPILRVDRARRLDTDHPEEPEGRWHQRHAGHEGIRSEEHTSELQSQSNLVCRLLLEKKKKKIKQQTTQLKESKYTQFIVY